MTIDLVALTEAKEIKQKKLGERLKQLVGNDPQLNAMMPDHDGVKAFEGDQPLERAIDQLLQTYGDRPALGMRDYRIVEDQDSGEKSRDYLPAFKTLSYAELRDNIQAVACAWTQDPSLKVERDDFVCLMGFASTEFAIIDTACHYAQAIPVPIQSTTSGVDIDDIFTNINPVAVAATIDDIVTAAEHVAKHGAITTLVAFDYDPTVDAEANAFQQAREILTAADCNTRLISFAELVAAGSGLSWTFLEPHPLPADERTAIIIHSSGSTGKPKGAMISEAALKASWNPQIDKLPSILVMFAPFNHGMGRMAMILTLRKGSTAYFTLKPDMSTLFEDIRIVRPTFLSFFPRVFELIYQYYQNEVAGRVQQGQNEFEAQQQVKAEMGKTFLGDRLVAGSIGSAPTPEAVKAFMVDCFDIYLEEGYGNTEMGAGSVTRDNIIQRPNVIDYKLDDVPELGYYTTDKPYPRGELCYKTRFQALGYINDPEATANLKDEEGFIKTGDIVEERARDYVVLIDRRKDVLKLSQGEYVAVGPLGTLFESGSPVIKQIYIYGNSSRAYILAVVVPDEEAVAAALGDKPAEAEIKNLIREELQKVAQQQQLKSFEVPRDFIVEPEPFSQENGLLSSVRKRLRPALKRKYGERLEAIYEEHSNKSQADYEALKDQNSPLSVLEKLVKLTEITLGCEGLDPHKPKTFNELGGDSLGAVTFSLSIEDIFAVSLPADSILSPTGNLTKWAREIESLLNDTHSRPTLASVHGERTDPLCAEDLALEKFLGESAVASAAHAAPVAQQERTVLITGANGFLGRQVCLQWMQRLAPIGGRVICLVRAQDDASARHRLDQVFAGADGELEAHYQQLARQHLVVMAGDAGEACLGLGEDRFNQLAEEVDRICHVAALVNHRLAYEHLFAPNVAGTAEIIRLAVSHRKKMIDFVSTEAVLRLVDLSGSGSNENAPLLETVPNIDERYAGGYATSKWAGEHLLQRAHRELGVPVNILRGDMMLAHRNYVEQINYTDTFSRLLYSIVLTGIAPVTFFERKADGTLLSESYDGLPVDVVAAGVVAAANFRHQQCRTFNIHNYHHGDGCTLDAFVDWIESAGYPVNRIDDYDEWFQRFQEKLRSLPEQQRQRSALEILGAYQTPRNGTEDIHPDSENFQSLVRSFEHDTDIPHLDEKFIHKCLRDIAGRYGI